MSQYEYKVVAAPSRGLKAKGIKTAEARFAHAIEKMINEMAGEGWVYQRAETLPSIERTGLTSTTTNWRNIFVFRRKKPETGDVILERDANHNAGLLVASPPERAEQDHIRNDCDHPDVAEAQAEDIDTENPFASGETAVLPEVKK